RREYRSAADGPPALLVPGRSAGGGRGRARRAVRRGGRGLRRTQGGEAGERRRDHRVLPRAPGRLQVPEDRPRRRVSAEGADRQGFEARATENAEVGRPNVTGFWVLGVGCWGTLLPTPSTQNPAPYSEHGKDQE